MYNLKTEEDENKRRDISCHISHPYFMVCISNKVLTFNKKYHQNKIKITEE